MKINAGGSAIKNIQTGIASNVTSGYTDIPIDRVNIDKATIRTTSMNGYYSSGSGTSIYGYSRNTCGGSFLDDMTLRLHHPSIKNGATVYWEIKEYA